MKTMSLRMPDYLKNAVNDVCANEKISLNQFIINALSEKVSALQTLDIIEEVANDIIELEKQSEGLIKEILGL